MNNSTDKTLERSQLNKMRFKNHKSAKFKLQDMLLFILVLSLPYENWDKFLNLGAGSIVKYIGLIYIASCVVFLNKLSNKRILKFISPLLFLLFWIFLRNIFEFDLLTKLMIPFVNNIVLLLIISIHLSIGGIKILNKIIALFTFGIALLSIFVSFFQLLKVEFHNNRLFFMGMNPNDFSQYIVIAVIFLTFIVLYDILKLKRKRFLLFLLLYPLFNVLVLTGSRGGILFIIIGLLFLLYFSYISFSSKSIIFVFLLGSLFVGYNILKENENTTNRLIEVVRADGNTLGNRTPIWNATIEIIKSNFFIGSGINGYNEFMIKKIGEAKSSHNGFLYLLSINGLPGLFFFIVFLVRILKYGMKIKNLRGLFWALFIIQILFISKSGSFFGFKLLWFTFALLIGIILTEFKERRFMYQKK